MNGLTCKEALVLVAGLIGVCTAALYLRWEKRKEQKITVVPTPQVLRQTDLNELITNMALKSEAFMQQLEKQALSDLEDIGKE